MEGSVKDLSGIRFEKALEMLRASEKNLEQNELRTSLNRSYYAIFHAMRSVKCLDGFDSSKHSGVIAHFNEYTLKTHKMDPRLSEIIKKASYCREKADYDDFYIVSRSEVEEQLRNAHVFIDSVSNYLEKANDSDT